MGRKIKRHLSEYVYEAQDPLELKPENFSRKRSEEKFTCVNQSCGKSFKTRGARNFHVQYHCAKPMRYKCERCDYKTHWKNDVKKHARSKHPELETNVIELFKVRSANKVHSYSCPNEHCSRTYTAKSSLYKHLKLHTPSPPFPKAGLGRIQMREFRAMWKHFHGQENTNAPHKVRMWSAAEVQMRLLRVQITQYRKCQSSHGKDAPRQGGPDRRDVQPLRERQEVLLPPRRLLQEVQVQTGPHLSPQQ
ncbi:GSCOCG00002827001-RA-CDS [Cotesia congregata]|nr:GSCOCG00002827001-RA-CDS [Cotesia congregata]